MSAKRKEVRDRVAFLRGEIERLDHAYYVFDQPEVDDAVYDNLFHELKMLEQAHPELADPPRPRSA